LEHRFCPSRRSQERSAVGKRAAAGTVAALLSSLAGPVLDKVLGVDGAQWRQNQQDRWSATLLAVFVARDRTVEDLLTAAKAGLPEMLDDPTTLKQIAAVAAALSERKTLSGDEVTAIMCDALAGVGP